MPTTPIRKSSPLMAGGFTDQPANLLNAISEIQQFYVIESKGQNIPAEFLTLERTLDFFRIGVKSGFHEGAVLLFLLPIFQFYLIPFALRQLDPVSLALLDCVPYMALIVNTLMCSYVSRYYVGNITRKSINTLLMGRVMSLLLKSCMIYVLYLGIFRLSTPVNIWKLAQWFGSSSEKIYYGFFAVKPHILPLATESAILMIVAAIFPYGSVYLLDLWHRHQIRRNNEIISAR